MKDKLFEEKIENSQKLNQRKAFLPVEDIKIMYESGMGLKDCLMLFFVTKCNKNATQPCFRSANNIAEIFGTSKGFVEKVLAQLMKSGFVHREGVVGKRKREWHLGIEEICPKCRTQEEINKVLEKVEHSKAKKNVAVGLWSLFNSKSNSEIANYFTNRIDSFDSFIDFYKDILAENKLVAEFDLEITRKYYERTTDEVRSNLKSTTIAYLRSIREKQKSKHTNITFSNELYPSTAIKFAEKNKISSFDTWGDIQDGMKRTHDWDVYDFAADDSMVKVGSYDCELQKWLSEEEKAKAYAYYEKNH